MPGLFRSMGIAFQYPENWSLDEEDALEGQQSVTVYSPSGAFWSISIHPHRTDLAILANQALEAIKEEYGDTDVEEIQETVSGHDLMGYDMNFFALDLTSTAKVRCLRTGRAAYAVFCQAEDGEMERLDRVFAAITVSLLRSLKRSHASDEG
jgi:hypothetical protein